MIDDLLLLNAVACGVAIGAIAPRLAARDKRSVSFTRELGLLLVVGGVLWSVARDPRVPLGLFGGLAAGAMVFLIEFALHALERDA
jgi:hypothetical protein